MRKEVVLVGLVALVIAATFGYEWKKRHPTHDPWPTPPPAKPQPMVDTSQHCDTIRAQYQTMLDGMQTCDADADCAVDQRGQALTSLDGCARFRRRDANVASLDAVARAWFEHGCSSAEFMTCRPERVHCRLNRCVELPPDPIPPEWHRVTQRDRFSFFVPAEAVDQHAIGEDSEAGEHLTPHSRISFDYGEYGTNITGESEADVVLRREPIVVGNSHGVLTATQVSKGEFYIGVEFRDLQNTISNRERVLTLWTACERQAQCAKEGEITARSLELH